MSSLRVGSYGEAAKDIASRLDSSEYDVWMRAFCWYHGYEYEEDLEHPVVSYDFKEYMESLGGSEWTPDYVNQFVRNYVINLEA